MERFLSIHGHTFTDCEKCLQADELSSEITFCEVPYAIDNLKADKPPGDDGIPSEFFTYATDTCILITGNFLVLGLHVLYTHT